MASAIDSSGVNAVAARCLSHKSNRNSRDWSRVGLNITPLGQRRSLERELLLLAEFALRVDGALAAQGLARHARITPVKDQVVVRVAQVFLRRHLEQLRLDLERVFPRGEPGAVGDAKDVRVDRDRKLFEGN